MSKKVPEGHSELSLYVPKDIKIQFKSRCAKYERTMSDVTKELIEKWLKEND